MTVAQIRSTIVGAIQDGDAVEHVEPSLLAAFEKGEQDIPLADLKLDSLMRMELLVTLEMEHDAVIPPEVFAGFQSLRDVAAHVESYAAELEGESTMQDRLDGASNALAEFQEPAPRPIRLFQRAFRGCRTVAHMNRLLEHFEGRLTPVELTLLADWLKRGWLLPRETPPKFGAALSEWLERIQGWMRGSDKAELEPFQACRIRPAARYFTGPGMRAEKTLLICFAVHSSWRLWMPQAVFLQHVDAGKYDVLVLGDLWDTAFRSGVPQMGSTVVEFARSVASLELVSEYGRVRAMGCSAGAYPALLTGRLAGAEATFCISGRFPSERYMSTLVKMYFNSWVSSLRNRRARTLFVHVAVKRRDTAYARRLAWVAGGSRLKIELPEQLAYHEFIEPLVEHGELRLFLERTLFAPADADLLVRRGKTSTMRFLAD